MLPGVGRTRGLFNLGGLSSGGRVWPCPGLYDPTVGEDDQLRPVAQVELEQQMGHVRLHRGLGEHQELGDLAVGASSRDELQDLVIADRGAAIVTVERTPADALVATGIERLPFDLGAVTDRVRTLHAAPEGQDDTRWVIDAEGLGNALWAVLGHADDHEHWQLYSGRGLERQALVDELLLAVQEDRFRFAAGLAEMDAMSRALTSYRRVVRDDGLIGSELVVALLLAIIPPKPEIVPLVAWF